MDRIVILYLLAEGMRIAARTSIILKALYGLPRTERSRHVRMMWY